MIKGIGTEEIKTERLILRRFREGDAEEVYDYGRDPEISRFICFAPYSSPEGAEDFVRMHLDMYDSEPDFYGWAIEREGRIIGSIGLFNVDRASDSCELGYTVGRKYQGRGYACEAARAVISYAFARAGLHRVYASHHIDNAASGRVMEKCGMRFEGIMRGAQKNTDGSFSDLKLYAILSGDPREGE